jgi:hypothetical protein
MLLRKSIFILFLLCLNSCANVKQIDRGRHSSKIMSLNPLPEEAAFLDSVNTYREGAAGGTGAVGGGCGCN